MSDSEYIILCECGDKCEHVVHIAQYDLGEPSGDDNLGTCLISTRLDPYRPWYKRLWVGIKYIFGYNQYQYIDSMIDVEVLKNIVNNLSDNRTDIEKQKALEKRSERSIKVI